MPAPDYGDNDARIPLRFPSQTHRELKYLARARGTSMNQLVNEAVEIHIQVLKEDPEVMSQVRAIVKEEQATLNNLGGEGRPPGKKKGVRKKRPAAY